MLEKWADSCWGLFYHSTRTIAALFREGAMTPDKRDCLNRINGDGAS